MIKNLSKSLLVLAAFAAVSCSKDDGPSDNAAPVITIESPKDNDVLAAGSKVTVSGTVTDDVALAEVDIAIRTAAGVPIFTFNVATFTDPKSYTLNQEVDIPGATPAGDYDIVVMAKDQSGKSSEKVVKVKVEAGCTAFCATAGQVTFVVTVPENTPANEKIHIVGSFNNWDPGAENYALTQSPNNPHCFCISLPFTGGEEYKFARGSWEKVEKRLTATSCEEVDNRVFEAGTQVVNISISAWRDIDAGCE